MTSMGPGELAVLLIVGAYVSTAAFWDAREKRIPNWLTIPMFFAGCGYQGIMSVLGGWEHLWSAATGFLIGFGILFVLWVVGGGGAGDVKLMGALGVWLGGGPTLRVLFGTVLLICLITIIQLVLRWIRIAVVTVAGERQPVPGPGGPARRRSALPFATPVAIATWTVLLGQLLLQPGQSVGETGKFVGKLPLEQIHPLDE